MLSLFDVMCEKCLYCYADPSLQPTNPAYANDIDNQQSLFFTYLRDHMNEKDSLDAVYLHEFVPQRLSQCLLWDDVQRAYFMETLSVGEKKSIKCSLN